MEILSTSGGWGGLTMTLTSNSSCCYIHSFVEIMVLTSSSPVTTVATQELKSTDSLDSSSFSIKAITTLNNTKLPVTSVHFVNSAFFYHASV